MKWVGKDRTRFGNVLETFVFGALLKHTTTAEGDYSLMYYRDADKVEVDVVVENADFFCSSSNPPA